MYNLYVLGIIAKEIKENIMGLNFGSFGDLMLDDESLTKYFFDINPELLENIFEISDFDKDSLEKKVMDSTCSNLEKTLDKTKKLKTYLGKCEQKISRLREKPISKKRQLKISNLETDLHIDSNYSKLFEDRITFYSDVLTNLANFVDNGIKDFYDIKTMLEAIIHDYQNENTEIKTQTRNFYRPGKVEIEYEVWYDKGGTYGGTFTETEKKEILITEKSYYKAPLIEIPEHKIGYIIKSLNSNKKLFTVEPLCIPSYNSEEFSRIDNKVGFKYNEEVSSGDTKIWGGTIPI